MTCAYSEAYLEDAMRTRYPPHWRSQKPYAAASKTSFGNLAYALAENSNSGSPNLFLKSLLVSNIKKVKGIKPLT